MPWGFGRGWAWGGGWGFGPGWGRGWGLGWGFGRGWGWWYPFCRVYPWLPRGWRWMYLYGIPPTYPYSPTQTYPYPPSFIPSPGYLGTYNPELELELLRNQARMVEEELKRINERISEIEKKQ